LFTYLQFLLDKKSLSGGWNKSSLGAGMPIFISGVFISGEAHKNGSFVI
jgi:hypothetical protein